MVESRDRHDKHGVIYPNGLLDRDYRRPRWGQWATGATIGVASLSAAGFIVGSGALFGGRIGSDLVTFLAMLVFALSSIAWVAVIASAEVLVLRRHRRKNKSRNIVRALAGPQVATGPKG